MTFPGKKGQSVGLFAIRTRLLSDRPSSCGPPKVYHFIFKRNLMTADATMPAASRRLQSEIAFWPRSFIDVNARRLFSVTIRRRVRTRAFGQFAIRKFDISAISLRYASRAGKTGPRGLTPDRSDPICSEDGLYRSQWTSPWTCMITGQIISGSNFANSLAKTQTALMHASLGGQDNARP
jgi:hypothetical protein